MAVNVALNLKGEWKIIDAKSGSTFEFSFQPVAVANTFEGKQLSIGEAITQGRLDGDMVVWTIATGEQFQAKLSGDTFVEGEYFQSNGDKIGDFMGEKLASPLPGDKMLLSTSAQVKGIIGDAEPTRLNRTVNRLLQEVKIPDEETLECVVRAFFEMVTNDTVDDHEHDCSKKARCGETYADITFGLRAVAPKFRIAEDMFRILLNVIQDAFEKMRAKFSSAETAEECDQKAKHNLIALVSFIGHLYVRGLVAERDIAQVVYGLIGVGDELDWDAVLFWNGLLGWYDSSGVEDRWPEEVSIRCVCELMQCIGQAADAKKQCNMLMTQILARLCNLAASQNPETQEPIYSQEVRESIRAVHEARSRKWPARAGTQVLVQYDIVNEDDARELLANLKKENQLPVDQMALSGPNGIEDSGSHIRISSMISGQTIAVLLSKDAAALKGDQFKEDISCLTSIHAARLMVLKPDGTPLED